MEESVFVGRSHELQELHEHLDKALSGNGRIGSRQPVAEYKRLS